MTRVIAITGARSGIGRALADMLRTEGHRVISADISDCDVNADLSTPQGRAETLAGILAGARGTLDGVAICAGVGNQTPAAISVNYFGATAILVGLRPLLATSAAPRAVAISSIAAIDPTDPEVLEACLAGDERHARRLADPDSYRVYSSSKAALTSWCRNAACSPEWAGSGILLNIVAPGLIRTPMTHGLMQDPDMMTQLGQAIPQAVGRWGEADDIARLLAFCLSTGNSYMVGQLVFVDGGAEARRRHWQSSSAG